VLLDEDMSLERIGVSQPGHGVPMLADVNVTPLEEILRVRLRGTLR
jgi:hypothetical protein